MMKFNNAFLNFLCGIFMLRGFSVLKSGETCSILEKTNYDKRVLYAQGRLIFLIGIQLMQKKIPVKYPIFYYFYLTYCLLLGTSPIFFEIKELT